MELTPEQIQAAQEHLTKNGYVIRTADDEKKFLETHTQTQIDQVFSQRNKQLEDTVLETLGVKKNTDEKWYDHFKRAVTLKAQEIQDLKKKITEYETKGVGSETVVNEYKSRLENLTKTYNDEKTQLSTQLTQLQQQLFQTKIDTMFEHTLSAFRSKFNDNIPFIEDVIANRKAKFMQEVQAKEFEGSIIWQKDGKTIQSKQDGRPVSLEGALEPYFEDLFDKSKKQAGAGSGGGGKGTGGSGSGDSGLQRPENIKTQVQLHDWLSKEQKLNPASKEFADAFNKLKEGLKLR